MRPWNVWLIGAGLYVLVLLPPLLLPGGGRAHARAYLLEFSGAPATRLVVDGILNLAAFVPLGSLLARAAAAFTLSHVLIIAGAVAFFSLSVETLQFFMVSRYSSVLDVITNTAGAALGAIAAAGWPPRRALTPPAVEGKIRHPRCPGGA